MRVRANNGSSGGGSGVKAFYAIGTGSGDTVYSCFSSGSDEIVSYSYTATPTMIDDDYIKIEKTNNHIIKLTFKQDGYYAEGGGSGTTVTPTAKSSGDVVTDSAAYTKGLAIAYFV